MFLCDYMLIDLERHNITALTAISEILYSLFHFVTEKSINLERNQIQINHFMAKCGIYYTLTIVNISDVPVIVSYLSPFFHLPKDPKRWVRTHYGTM